MADARPTTPTPSSDDMHWGISYLREDIQDLRQDVRAIHSRIDGVNGRIDGVNDSLMKRIDSRFALLLTAMIALAGIIIGANLAFLQIFLPGN